jgi:kynurenine formamidase
MCTPKVMEYVHAQLSRRDFMKMGGSVVAGTALLGASQAQAQTKQKGFVYRTLVDLSHTLNPGFPLFPGGSPMTSDTLVTVEKDGYYLNRVSYGEHSGTHMDAPAHFISGGVTADKLPLENFIVPLAICDISERATKNPDSQVTIDDLVAWEKQYGRLLPNSFIMMNSGWAARVSDPKAYLNADASGTMHFPGFAPEASEFLVKSRQISGVGVDTLSLDFGAASAFKTHVNILGAGKYGLENVANLGNVPARGATLIVGIPRFENGSGGPARVIAAVP